MKTDAHCSKTAIVTGATSGLGFECAAILVAQGWHVVLACRDIGRGEAARKRIVKAAPGAAPDSVSGSVEVRELDVSDLGSVRRFVDAYRATGLPIRALVCNAGVQVKEAFSRTPDGLDTTFATNHLGHFLLARLMVGDMEAGGRIIFVSSDTHDPKNWTGMPVPKLDDVRAFAVGDAKAGHAGQTPMSGRQRYTTSKLCNVLCTYELDRRLRALESPRSPAVSVNAFDPGAMPGTGLARDYGPAARFAWSCILPALRLFVPNVNNVKTSARRLASLVASESTGVSGTYVSRGREMRSSAASYDTQLARVLWDTSSELADLPREIEPQR